MQQGRGTERECVGNPQVSLQTQRMEIGERNWQSLLFIIFQGIFKKRLYVRHFLCLNRLWASLVAQMAKNLLAMQETLVRSLGQEDPLEKGMASHSSALAWRIPWTEEPGGLQSSGLQRIRHD